MSTLEVQIRGTVQVSGGVGGSLDDFGCRSMYDSPNASISSASAAPRLLARIDGTVLDIWTKPSAARCSSPFPTLWIVHKVHASTLVSSIVAYFLMEGNCAAAHLCWPASSMSK